jgi:hypothetical protein
MSLASHAAQLGPPAGMRRSAVRPRLAAVRGMTAPNAHERTTGNRDCQFDDPPIYQFSSPPGLEGLANNATSFHCNRDSRVRWNDSRARNDGLTLRKAAGHVCRH